MNPLRYNYLRPAAVLASVAMFVVIGIGEYQRRERAISGTRETRMDVGSDGNGGDRRDRDPNRVAATCACCSDGALSQAVLREAPAPVQGHSLRVHDGGSGAVLPAHTRRLFTITAYCGGKCCCQQYADGITASGRPVTANGGAFVAADRSIPFGTLITVPGYNGGKPVPVLDRGGAIKGDRLDVYFPTHQAALNWGKRTLVCEISTANKGGI